MKKFYFIFALVLSFSIVLFETKAVLAAEYFFPMAETSVFEAFDNSSVKFDMAFAGQYVCSVDPSMVVDYDFYDKACEAITGNQVVDGVDPSWGVSMQGHSSYSTPSTYKGANLYYSYVDNFPHDVYYTDDEPGSGSALTFDGLITRPSFQISFSINRGSCSSSNRTVWFEYDQIDNDVYYLCLRGDPSFSNRLVSGSSEPYQPGFYPIVASLYTNYNVIYPPDYTGPEIPSEIAPEQRYYPYVALSVGPENISWRLLNPSTTGVEWPFPSSLTNLKYEIFKGSELIHSIKDAETWKHYQFDVSNFEYSDDYYIKTHIYVRPPGAYPKGFKLISPVIQKFALNGNTYMLLGGENIDDCNIDGTCEVASHAETFFDKYKGLGRALNGGPLNDLILMPIRLLSNIVNVFSNNYCSPFVAHIPMPYSNGIHINAPCMTQIYNDLGVMHVVEIFGSLISFYAIYNTYAWFARYVDSLLSFRENSAGLWGGL